jgi:hypothetical protein
MSIGNIHMGLEMAGVRVDVEETTAEHLMAQLKDYATWDIFLAACKSQRLYGNTKLTDLPIIAAIYRYELNMTEASRALGYSCTKNKYGTPSTKAIKFRLKRMNVGNMFEIIDVFTIHGFIPKETICSMLNIDGEFDYFQQKRRSNSIYEYYAKWYVVDMIKWFLNWTASQGIQMNMSQAVVAASRYTGVSEDTMRYWLNKDVADIMVKPS